MNETQKGDGWWVITFVIGMVALITGIIGIVIASDNSDGTRAVAASDSGASGGTTEFDVTLAEMSISPSMIEVPAGEEITVHVTNAGVMPHDFKVMGTTGTEMLDPGEEVDIIIGPFTSDTEVWCTVPGHKEAGMTMAVKVAGGKTDGSTTDTTVPGNSNATIDAAAMPGTDWIGRDPVLAAAEASTLHEITLDATETLVEVAPGVTQMMWTFNDLVPGPTLRGNVGDTFRITLTNSGEMGHSIDFHASQVAWSDEMRTILPGESLVYEFTADLAGAFMYHCGTAPALHHIGNGMYGAIIIDPPELAPVEEEFFIVQSELYLGPEGQPGDLTKMINEEWDAVVFNGFHSQYKFAPIHVEAGKRYRIWVINDGPNENSAFHIVGTIFDTVFKEGALTLQPDDTRGGSQVLDLQPAQGGYVEFTFAEDGLYPFVTHKFANVGKGAIGFFAVGDVDTSALTGH